MCIADVVGCEVELRLIDGEIVSGLLMELPYAADQESYAVIATPEEFRWVNVDEIEVFRATRSPVAA